MSYRELLETGIRTAAIDIIAKEAIYAQTKSITKNILASLGDKIPLEPDSVDDRWFNFYDKCYTAVWAESNYTEMALEELNEILTKITREYVSKTLSDDHMIELASEVIIDIEAEETSKDPYAGKAGGYFSQHKRMVKIFVDGTKIREAICWLIHEEIFGDSEKDGRKALTNVISSIFAHEYAHLEQMLRGKTFQSYIIRKGKVQKPSDFGYIHGPKGRGGLRRSPQDSQLDKLLYYGASHEIDSFAAQAASEIVSHIETKSWNSFNSDLKSFLEDLKHGYITDRSYVRYRDLMNNTIAGYYAEHNLNPEQMRFVWQRFQKKLYQKLVEYLKPEAGKGSDSQAKNLDSEWLKIARVKSRKEFIRFLADAVAEAIIQDSIHESDVTPDKLMKWSYELGNAKMFIRTFYYGDPYNDDPSQEKTIEIFTKMVRAAISAKLSR